jgi:glycosyltransferase involved in cell wall biosynthesis
MEISVATLDVGSEYLVSATPTYSLEGTPAVFQPIAPRNQELLRRVAWEIGEKRPAEKYAPDHNHVNLAMVHNTQGFIHWRITVDWVQDVARSRGNAWDGSRPIVRLYDVSYITFTGLNANRIQDENLSGLTGQLFFNLPKPGTWQIAEVGFLLRNGEFIPAARSPAVPFAPDAPSKHGSSEALLVTGPRRIEGIGNVWDAEQVLRERRRPRLRHPLRIAHMTFASRPSGQQGSAAEFSTELAMGHRHCGHEVHVFVPASESLQQSREQDGVVYHPLTVSGSDALDVARHFSLAVERRLKALPPFDLIHLHEWMTGHGTWMGNRPTVLSLSSIEATRHTGTGDAMSQEIEQIERKVAKAAGCVLTPGWLRERAIGELQLEGSRVHPFAMEGRLANEWESPLDVGHVKMGYGIGPLDRFVLFIGPLEHAAGVDLLVEALPTLLRRWGNLRLVYVGTGPIHDHLARRAHELGVGGLVKLVGHQSGQALTNLLRASEGLILPARYRIPMDDSVVDLARKAARAVITTHGGPAHLVRHEENGLITYDNPGSMVWAIDRLLGDPGHAERMGQNGRRNEGGTLRWSDVARQYLEACVGWFPELTVTNL